MKTFRADLHIHTVLSPCSDLEMSPGNIIAKAKEKNLDLIGITDHNCTKNCHVTEQIGKEQGIMVLCGAEITTKEEAHCLAFFQTPENLNDFQHYLDTYLPDIQNDHNKFGYQLVVDENENIIEEIDKLLISAINQNMDEIESTVHGLNGLFIPAHIDRLKFSITSQLGFVPADIKADALELSGNTSKNKFLENNQHLKDFAFIQSSDAHYIHQIGTVSTLFFMEQLSFDEISSALKSKNGRRVEIR